MAAGRAVPFDLFGVHPYSKVKITSAKKKSAKTAEQGGGS